MRASSAISASQKCQEKQAIEARDDKRRASQDFDGIDKEAADATRLRLGLQSAQKLDGPFGITDCALNGVAVHSAASAIAGEIAALIASATA